MRLPCIRAADPTLNAKLDLTETWTYTCSTSNVLASFQNLATAKGTPPVGPDVTDQDTAEVVVIDPAIKIVKSPDSQTVRVGDTASFTLAVTNTGDVPLSTIVRDAKCDAPPVYQGGDANANAKLDLTETWTYTCSTSNVLASFQNLATAKGTPPVGPDVTDQDTAEVVVIHPAIKIVKSPDTQNVPLAGTATFTLTVTNGGDVALTNVVVTDNQCTTGPTYVSGDTGNDGSLGLTETWIYSCSIAGVTNDFTNAAHVTGKPPVGPNVTSDDTADVHVLRGKITVVKDFVAAPQGAMTTIRIKQGDTVKVSGDVADNGSINGVFAPSTFTVDETSGAGDVDLALYDQSVLPGER